MLVVIDWEVRVEMDVVRKEALHRLPILPEFVEYLRGFFLRHVLGQSTDLVVDQK